jgi:hypothetical protein
MTGPIIAAQRNSNLARRHSGTTKYPRNTSALLVDTPLSSSPAFANSTRHSVTSRIDRNSRILSYLIFSTRHLNATPENRNNVEKFNTCLRFCAASDLHAASPARSPLFRAAHSDPPWTRLARRGGAQGSSLGGSRTELMFRSLSAAILSGPISSVASSASSPGCTFTTGNSVVDSLADQKQMGGFR